MHSPVAQMVLQGPTIRQHKREKKALVRCIEKRAANSDELIRELCTEIDRLKLIITQLAQLLEGAAIDFSRHKKIRALIKQAR
jgi:hypothetical protein